jgi:hypothetical protein
MIFFFTVSFGFCYGLYLAVVLFLSGVLLLYTAIVSPAQIFVWEFKDEECNVFPTLYFDIFVDIFFMVMYISSVLFMGVSFCMTTNVLF